MSALQRMKGWPALLEGEALDRLEREALPAFLGRQRWYSRKARVLDSLRIVDSGRPEGFPPTSLLAMIEVRYREGASDRYFLPLAWANGPDADRVEREAPGRIIARLDADADDPGKGGVVYDGLADPATCWSMLMAIEQGRSVSTRDGQVHALATSAYSQARGPAGVPLEVARGTAEQSNSAVLFDHRLLLKVFRRIEPGINPDFEIGKFLSEKTDFARIPRTAGAIEYHRPGAEPATLAILQGMVRNEGTGWEHALHELARYYEDVGRRDLPDGSGVGPDVSPLTLSESEVPAAVRKVVGPYLRAAATLGRRT